MAVSQTSVCVQQRWRVAASVTTLTLKMKKPRYKSDTSEVTGLLVGKLQLGCTPSLAPSHGRLQYIVALSNSMGGSELASSSHPWVYVFG